MWCFIYACGVCKIRFYTAKDTNIWNSKNETVKKNRPHGATNDFIFISNHKYREDEKQRKKGKKKATKKNCVKNCSPVRVFCFSWRPEKYKTFFSRRGEKKYILRVPNSTLSALLTVINIPYWRQKERLQRPTASIFSSTDTKWREVGSRNFMGAVAACANTVWTVENRFYVWVRERWGGRPPWWGFGVGERPAGTSMFYRPYLEVPKEPKHSLKTVKKSEVT